MKNSRFSWKKRCESFSYAFMGVKRLVVEEHNFRIHLFATIVVIAISIAKGISGNQWLWILLSISLVWIAELFNTSIERLADEVNEAYRERIKLSKDYAAGAVLLASFFAVVVASVVFVLG